MKGIQSRFKLKGDKIEKPEIYLVVYLSKMTNSDNQECSAMSSDKYCTAAVTNVESVWEKAWLEVASEVCYPSEMWLLSRDGCDIRDQGIWIIMVPINNWHPEVISVSL